MIERKGKGRRKSPDRDGGTCLAHEYLDRLIVSFNGSLEDVKNKNEEIGNRLSAIEPTVAHNLEEIDAMRKLQLATLVTGLISALGIISMLIVLYLGKFA